MRSNLSRKKKSCAATSPLGEGVLSTLRGKSNDVTLEENLLSKKTAYANKQSSANFNKDSSLNLNLDSTFVLQGSANQRAAP